MREQVARDGERLGVAALHHRFGVGAQEGGERGGALRADLLRERVRGEAGQGLDIGDARAQRRIAAPERFALPRERVGIGEAADGEGERPAVLRRQLRPALHRRAFEPLADHLVEAEQAAMAGAVAVGEGDRVRIELARGRGVGKAGGAVAGGAILGIEPGAAGEIGRLLRRERDRIGAEQPPGEAVGAPLDLVGRDVRRDRGRELLRLGDQGGALRIGGQGGDALGDRAGKFAHLGELAGADDAAVGADRAAIIDRHIIEQPPGGLHLRIVGARRRRDEDGKRQQDGEEQPPRAEQRIEHGAPRGNSPRGLAALRLIINSGR